MLVSVIVPVYNTQDYLDKCIESLLRQTYKNIEVILVNDGSTDHSLEVCKKYASQDARIAIINKENGGASSARNAGIRVATGEYIMFADSDDYVDENYVREMVDAQSENKDAFVICDLCGILSDGGLLPFHEKIKESGVFNICDYYRFSKWLILNQPYNKIFALEKVKANNILFKEDLPIGEDIYFNLEYLMHCKKIYFVNKQLYYCLRDRDSSLCHREYKNLLDIYRLVFYKHMELFSLFQVSEKYKNTLLSGHYGEHVDCLDREIEHTKPKKIMFSNMKDIFGSDAFQMCLKHCKKDIPRLYYLILNTKSPRVYYWYHKLSKLRGNK